MFDVGIFLAAMGITLLEMAEASAVGIVLATESRNSVPYLAAAAGVITILIPTALAGNYIQLLPILYVRLASAILLLYFGLRLVKSARRSFKFQILGPPKNSKHHDEREKGIRIRNRPFLGVVGTAPKEGTYGMIPPQVFGGNMDTKTICTGSILMLPVNVDGALVSFGDPHGSQGDGEVCGTAIETEATIKVRFSTVEESIKRPMIISEEYSTGRTISASGISEDLHIAAQMAVLDMIKYLMKRGLSG